MPLMTVVLLLALFVLPIFYFLWEKITRKRLFGRLSAAWARESALRKLDPEELADAAWYYKSQPRDEDSPDVDDTTWSDLDMDSVFSSLDASISVAGSEALYAMLRRQGADDADLRRRESLSQAFLDDGSLRLEAQVALYGIGRRAFHGAWRYLQDAALQVPRHAWLYRVLAVLPLALCLLGLVHSAFLLAAAAAFLLNLVVHYKSQATWQKEVAAIRHLGAVIRSARKLSATRQPGLQAYRAMLLPHQKRLRPLRAFLPLFGVEAFGDMAVVMEYLRIFLLLDMVSFVSIAATIRREIAAVRAVYALVGEVDACLSLAQWQAREPGLCQASFHDQTALSARGLCHPLVADCVANDLDWRRNLLISGSNASGKSTFIKAVAVNLILAQTTGLCRADSFALRRGRVMSAMAVRDNLLGGESYFVVEIKSLKRVLDQLGHGMIYCFIDEILRGTNTVERVAASSAVLEALAGPDTLCMAATHDIELTRILEGRYDNRHFSETVGAQGIAFDYKLKDGPTRTRNAIRLLKQLGYDGGIIKEANARAERFDRTGKWQAES